MLKQKEAEYDAKLATKKKKALSKPAEVVLKTNSHYFNHVQGLPPKERTQAQVSFMLGYIDAEPGTEGLDFVGYDFYAD
jgi:hypothetical protein